MATAASGLRPNAGSLEDEEDDARGLLGRGVQAKAHARTTTPSEPRKTLQRRIAPRARHAGGCSFLPVLAARRVLRWDVSMGRTRSLRGAGVTCIQGFGGAHWMPSARSIKGNTKIPVLVWGSGDVYQTFNVTNTQIIWHIRS